MAALTGAGSKDKPKTKTKQKSTSAMSDTEVYEKLSIIFYFKYFRAIM